MKKRYVSPAIEVERLLQADIVCASSYDELEENPLDIFDQEQDQITQPGGIW